VFFPNEMRIFSFVLKVQEKFMKEQASAVKKREDELGTVIAQVQIDKAKPVCPFLKILFDVIVKFIIFLFVLCIFGADMTQ